MPHAHWKLIVEGEGQHHEGSILDADHIARNLVRDLNLAGHVLTKGSITPGPADTASDDIGVVVPKKSKRPKQPKKSKKSKKSKK